MKFKCSNCKNKGKVALIMQPREDFLMSRWYTDEKGYNHDIMICNKCGAIHDIQFSTIKIFFYFLYKNPYRTINYISFETFIADIMKRIEEDKENIVTIFSDVYSFNHVISNYMSELIEKMDPNK